MRTTTRAKRRGLLGLALLLALALVIAACAEDDPDDVADPDPEPDEEEEDAPPEEDEVAEDPEEVDEEAPFPTGGTLEIGLGSPPDSEQALIVHNLREQLEEELGTSLAFRYITGAGHRIISNYTYEEARDDGYYVQIHAVPVTTAGQVYFDGEYDTEEFQPVANLTASDRHIIVLEDSEFETIDDLIEAGREGELQRATAGIGTSDHLAGVILGSVLDLNIQDIPHDGGGEAIAAFMGGHTDFHIAQTHHAVPRDDDIRVLAHLMDEGHDRWPDVPTVEEAGYDWIEGQGLTLSFGVVAPPGTPQDRVDALTEAFANVMADDEVQETIRGMGLEPNVLEGDEYGQMITQSLGVLEDFRDVLEPALAE